MHQSQERRKKNGAECICVSRKNCFLDKNQILSAKHRTCYRGTSSRIVPCLVNAQHVYSDQTIYSVIETSCLAIANRSQKHSPISALWSGNHRIVKEQQKATHGTQHALNILLHRAMEHGLWAEEPSSKLVELILGQ